MSESITITGTVFSRDGDATTPLSGATVRADNEEARVTRWSTADDDGRYTLSGIEPGRWRMMANSPGFKSPPPVIGDFDEDSAEVDIELSKAVQVSGTVYWYGSDERVVGALVRATSDTGANEVAICDDDGDFRFSWLEPRKWTFVAMHDDGVPSKPEVENLVEDIPNLRFQLFRRMGTPDEKSGRRFFYVLVVALVLVSALYVGLHLAVPERSDLLVTGFDDAVSKAWTDAGGVVETDTFRSNVSEISRQLEIALAGPSQITAGEAETLRKAVSDLETTVQSDTFDQEKFKSQLASLGALAQARRVGFWSQAPWTYLEIFFWALAGILVGKLLEIGSYLRWRRFYVEGILMHISQILAVPFVVLVTILLLSLIEFSITLADSSTITVDLSNPIVLVTLAFILAAVPWQTWGIIRSAGQAISSRFPVNQSRKEPPGG